MNCKARSGLKAGPRTPNQAIEKEPASHVGGDQEVEVKIPRSYYVPRNRERGVLSVLCVPTNISDIHQNLTDTVD